MTTETDLTGTGTDLTDGGADWLFGIRPWVNELSTTIWVEIIEIKPASGALPLIPSAQLRPGACLTGGSGCHQFNGAIFQRDLYDPAGLITVQDILARRRLKAADFNLYQRTPHLIPIAADANLDNRMSIVAISVAIQISLDSIVQHLTEHREIMPTRMLATEYQF